MANSNNVKYALELTCYLPVGDSTREKWDFLKITLDEDGSKETEMLFWGYWDEVPNEDMNPYGEIVYVIEEKLGFLPEGGYEIYC